MYYRLNHAVKRHKPNENQKPNVSRLRKNLYDNLHHLTPTTITHPASTDPSQLMNCLDGTSDVLDGEHHIKTEANLLGDPNSIGEDDLLMQDIKKEPIDGEDDKLQKSLYTSKGLQPDCHDLDQLFDEDDSGGSPSLGVS